MRLKCLTVGRHWNSYKCTIWNNVNTGTVTYMHAGIETALEQPHICTLEQSILWNSYTFLRCNRDDAGTATPFYAGTVMAMEQTHIFTLEQS